jgi:hypothetical protein
MIDMKKIGNRLSIVSGTINPFENGAHVLLRSESVSGNGLVSLKKLTKVCALGYFFVSSSFYHIFNKSQQVLKQWPA